MKRFLDFIFKRPVPKTIEADDSGFGSLYGGAIILVTDGKKDYYKEVPLKLFAIKEKVRRNNSIKKETARIVKSGLRALHAKPDKTKVQICQGNNFDCTEQELKRAGFMVQRVKITGRTNTKAEQLFKELLEKKYKIKGYSPKDYRKENLRQYAILKERRDFRNVKRNSKGVAEMKACD